MQTGRHGQEPGKGTSAPRCTAPPRPVPTGGWRGKVHKAVDKQQPTAISMPESHQKPKVRHERREVEGQQGNKHCSQLGKELPPAECSRAANAAPEGHEPVCLSRDVPSPRVMAVAPARASGVWFCSKGAHQRQSRCAAPNMQRS